MSASSASSTVDGLTLSPRHFDRGGYGRRSSRVCDGDRDRVLREEPCERDADTASSDDAVFHDLLPHYAAASDAAFLFAAAETTAQNSWTACSP